LIRWFVEGIGTIGEECHEDGFDGVAMARRVARAVLREAFGQSVVSWDFALSDQSETVNMLSLLKSRWVTFVDELLTETLEVDSNIMLRGEVCLLELENRNL
jgi:hypothetical protein